MLTTLKTYRNRESTTKVAVIMDGQCVGLNVQAGTCVRRTVNGGYAVIRTAGDRLVCVFLNEGDARRYNSALRG